MHISLQRDKRTSFYYPNLQPPRYKKTGVVAMGILDLTLRLSARLGVRLRPRTTPEETNKTLFFDVSWLGTACIFRSLYIHYVVLATIANTYNYDGTFVLPVPSTLAMTCNGL